MSHPSKSYLQMHHEAHMKKEAREKEEAKRLRVSVTMTVEIDREQWKLAYGEESPSQIREAVKATADEVVKEHFRRTGVLHEAGT